MAKRAELRDSDIRNSTCAHTSYLLRLVLKGLLRFFVLRASKCVYLMAAYKKQIDGQLGGVRNEEALQIRHRIFSLTLTTEPNELPYFQCYFVHHPSVLFFLFPHVQLTIYYLAKSHFSNPTDDDNSQSCAKSLLIWHLRIFCEMDVS